MRWRNVQADKRNIFIHFDHMLFLLTYHKALNLTTASRYPARFLLEEVADLLLRFLVLIQPFRIFASHQIKVPAHVSEYLFSSGPKLWPDEKMTLVLQESSMRFVGQRINIQAWRQMAVGFAIKFFGGPNGENPLLGDLAVIGEAEDEEDYVVEPFSANRLPDAWHWAASHTPRTANQNYGLTVDFRQGLTDAALQEYFNVCRQWHLLVYPRLARGAAAAPPDREIGGGARKHTRAQSSVTNISLVKRMALREAPQRPLRQ